MKMQNEGRKIMHYPEFRASVTCVRVPVYRAHSIAVSAEFVNPVSLDVARECLRKVEGLDFLEGSSLPMPLDCAERHNVVAGRLRVDCALDNGLAFFVCGDQILKGAALNAVQIAQKVYEMGYLN
jgi:aspartate-semialdehyde dehydrogenase